MFRFSEARTLHPTDISILETIDDNLTRYEQESGTVFLAKQVTDQMRRLTEPRFSMTPKTRGYHYAVRASRTQPLRWYVSELVEMFDQWRGRPRSKHFILSITWRGWVRPLDVRVVDIVFAAFFPSRILWSSGIFWALESLYFYHACIYSYFNIPCPIINELANSPTLIWLDRRVIHSCFWIGAWFRPFANSFRMRIRLHVHLSLQILLVRNPELNDLVSTFSHHVRPYKFHPTTSLEWRTDPIIKSKMRNWTWRGTWRHH